MAPLEKFRGVTAFHFPLFMAHFSFVIAGESQFLQ